MYYESANNWDFFLEFYITGSCFSWTVLQYFEFKKYCPMNKFSVEYHLLQSRRQEWYHRWELAYLQRKLHYTVVHWLTDNPAGAGTGTWTGAGTFTGTLTFAKMFSLCARERKTFSDRERIDFINLHKNKCKICRMSSTDYEIDHISSVPVNFQYHLFRQM